MLVWCHVAPRSCTAGGEGCEQAEKTGVTTHPPPPAPKVAEVQLCLWLCMLLNGDAAVNYWETVIHVYILLSVFFINSPRPTPDIACCGRKTTNVDRQLMASGRYEPGLVLPHSPRPEEKTFPHVISFPSWGLWHRLAAGLSQTRTCLNMHCCYMINVMRMS